MTLSETPPISLLKQPMRNLDSSNMCLYLLVLTAEPHFDVLLTKNGLIYSAMYLISIIYYNNVGKHWERR